MSIIAPSLLFLARINMGVIGCGARLKLYALTSLERDAISAIVRRMNLVAVYATQIKSFRKYFIEPILLALLGCSWI